MQLADFSTAAIGLLTVAVAHLCARLLKSCYRASHSEEVFWEAYKSWDKFAKDPGELERLIEQRIAASNPKAE